MNFFKVFTVSPGKKVNINDYPTDSTEGCVDKGEAVKEQHEILTELQRLQFMMNAEGRRSLLVILQGMDASGKDGTVRCVFSGLNPQHCRVTSFKTPTPTELAHDFLWRIHMAVPASGEIGIFNRSHYEDVLIARVQKLVPEKVWRPRYEIINEFERYITAGGVTVVKFFLHISAREQKKRLLERLDDSNRNWKFSISDIQDRLLWNDYQNAYSEMISRCSTPWAPWFIIPSDKKWYRNWAITNILREIMEKMKCRFPHPLGDAESLKMELLKQDF